MSDLFELIREVFPLERRFIFIGVSYGFLATLMVNGVVALGIYCSIPVVGILLALVLCVILAICFLKKNMRPSIYWYRSWIGVGFLLGGVVVAMFTAIKGANLLAEIESNGGWMLIVIQIFMVLRRRAAGDPFVDAAEEEQQRCEAEEQENIRKIIEENARHRR